MYLDLSITSDENAMLSGSDGQNYQSGGGVFVGQLGWCPHSIKISSVITMKSACML